METLTLKELAPYFPYKVKVKIIGQNRNYKIGSIHVMSAQLIHDKFKNNTNYDIFRPILYPLDYLTKPITHNGETFVPLDKLNELFGYQEMELTHYTNAGIGWNISSSFASTAITFDDMYLPIQKLFEWRFDVFNLINLGLAMPITQEFNPYK